MWAGGGQRALNNASQPLPPRARCPRAVHTPHRASAGPRRGLVHKSTGPSPLDININLSNYPDISPDLPTNSAEEPEFVTFLSLILHGQNAHLFLTDPCRSPFRCPRPCAVAQSGPVARVENPQHSRQRHRARRPTCVRPGSLPSAPPTDLLLARFQCADGRTRPRRASASALGADPESCRARCARAMIADKRTTETDMG